MAQTDPIYDSIKVLNLDSFATKPVDSFLRSIPQSYDDIGLYGILKNNKVGGLGIHYPNGTQILIRPLRYLYMNPIDPNNVWDINLFKKETAHRILVMAPEGALSGQE